ncbi:MAG: geranylgeranylglyceryl/heptaprenylglyceryl phosphate synthase [Aigarchaeota archaeon]|nr:geranylgeranylglyceryl/heptaprenylglyceryl phosphate synthase [Aigarchaeota archaeon]MCX8192677.1 geranylgeranylglyceryl/heptaprenylglyceryl phosphate synthase [Nitrososphaeria archaeon]MDW7985636.1 geranylgeranylglyceryl/heptaprenylglyceryl phosphate synthase [Nitrososphaerota archaeon]
MYSSSRPRTVKIGATESYILRKLENGPIHMTLLDPENISIERATQIAKIVEAEGSSAIMVGGSTVASQNEMDEFVISLKKNVKIPIIIFPNNVQALTKHADAVWYMSLLNSLEWYYIIGAQMQAAPFIKKHNIETIPMAYIVFRADTAVSAIGRVLPIPENHPEVVAAYALAAQYLGFRFVYLEAGSGAPQPIPSKVIKTIRSSIEIPLVVGGGIRSVEQINEVIKAGADIIVTGTLAEEDLNQLKRLINIVKSYRTDQ